MIVGRVLRSVAVIVAVGVFVAGCQSPTQAPAAAPATKAPVATQAPAPTSMPTKAPAPTVAPTAAPTAAPETLRIGIMASLTGPGSWTGTAAERYIRLGIDDVNAKGGFKVGAKTYRFDAVTADDKSNADGGREAANKLVLAEKVKFILGGTSSPVAAAQAVTEPAKVAFLTFTALDASLGPKFPYTVQVGYPYMPLLQEALVDWLISEHPTAKKIAFLYPDDATGRGSAATASTRSKDKKLEVIGQEFYPLDTKDFSPVVVRTLRQNPDALDLGTLGARGPIMAALATSLHDQGYKGPMFSMAADMKTMIERASIMEGWTTALLSDYKAAVVGDAEKQLIQRFIDKFGQDQMEPLPLPNYVGPSLLAQAMQQAGTVDDTTKVLDTLRSGQWDSMYGKRAFGGAKTFGLPSVFSMPIYLTQVKSGKLATIKAFNGVAP